MCCKFAIIVYIKITVNVISLLGVPEHIPSCTADVGKRSNCPSGCKCTDGVVDCRNRGLRHIPDNLPIDMTEM